ncbi:MAG TPA: CHAT domain-containing protein, partial [Ktedonobacteraceae bacterium]|nr:CHAT domain-containing protein [Ktedonobacteraceae bacterium]
MPLSASQKWRARQLQPSVPFTEDVEGYQQQREGLQLLQEAYEEFTQAWTAIRQHDDPDFMSPVPTLEGIARALAGPDEALVYLVAGLSMPRRFTSVKKTHTLPGIEPGFALMVTLNIDGTPRVQALSLPKLQSNAIDTLLEPVSETATEAASGPGYTRVRLEEALETLGDLGLNELATALMAQGVRKIRLVPYVRMGLFPLAAVNIQIPGRPSCRFGDFFELTFVPNARTAEVARERAEALAKKRQTFLFGGNPQPLATGSGLPSSSLPFAADEAVALYHVARAAGYYSKDLHYLRPEEMTKKRVVALLQTATNAYLALHGMYRPERPRDSVLVLAGGQEIPEGERTLSLGEILDGKINLHNLRLLVLSACETSLYDIHRQPDEVVGLAT